jgi:hypothetical protein
MSQASSAPVANLVLGETQTSSLGAMRWISPVILGLCAPMVLGLMMFPGLVEDARFVIGAVLAALVFVCAAAYTLSVVNPGNVTGLTLERSSRQIALMREGMFAVTTQYIAFEDVADLRLARRSDDDGYAIDVAELTTREGVTLILPASVTAANVVAARRVIGLQTGRA